MAKLTLVDLTNLNNQASAINTINVNNQSTETALENTLSRDGTSPNTMEADLDMNSNRILNLAAPETDNEPVRLIDLTTVAGATPSLTLTELTDVTITTPVDDQFLRYNGSGWVNEAVVLSAIGGAPNDADYIVKTANSGLSAERVGTDNTSITWDWGTAGVAKLSRAALTGDVTASANSNATTIANDAVTYAKLQNIATGSLIGRSTASIGDPETITVSTGLTISGGNLSVSSSYTGSSSITTLGTIVTGVWTGTTIAVANGGTGSTTASGARTNLGVSVGSDVQAYDAQLSSLIRQNSQSTAYTTVLTDSGKHILHPTADNNARTFTIDSNANVAYSIGTAITFVNMINTLTISITSDTMTLMGAGSTGARTLAASGIATALKVGTTAWIISGTNLT